MKPEFRSAAENGDTERLGILIDAGCDVNSKDKHGQTALMLAATHGHSSAVRLLIQHGADLDTWAKYRLTPLMVAVIRGHSEVARLLIEAGADLSMRGGKGALGFYGKTALELAQERGDAATVEILRMASAPGPDVTTDSTVGCRT